uniref:Uncharacterized protein LOC103329902 n=1 Tax=Rhizophora mucronata TaxID=61149 RepID=A0A2P2MVH9_RHIMU
MHEDSLAACPMHEVKPGEIPQCICHFLWDYD